MNWNELGEVFQRWSQLCGVAVLAAAVQMYISRKKFTFTHYFMSVLMAIFAAYLADSFCTYLTLADSLKTGIIGVSAYCAPHMMDGLDNFGKYIAKHPAKLISMFFKGKS
ncbi:phage holin family protein [Shewanella surugensis]|uniref:Phage holin family protein n=1 Tax=Shewanella surugensis TaxID=212020 RepID=A0ABT0L6K0_9GAMM|nr:phage holin family protein [Shewanella surugensis]MCL1123314.1 phage holin family protein [Shewanella surugensis]